MATVTEARFDKGTLTDSNATLYTAPAGAGNYVIVISLVLCNKSADSATVTIKADGLEVVSGFTITAHDTIAVPMAGLVLEAEEIIEGSSGTTGVINYYISGKVVTA
jgi:hypothetical protein